MIEPPLVSPAGLAQFAEQNGWTEDQAAAHLYRSNEQLQEQFRQEQALVERILVVAAKVEPPEPPDPKWSLDALYDLWVKKGWKITRKHKATLELLKAFLPDAPDFRTIPPQDIWRFQEHLPTLGLKWASQHNHLKNLRGLFSAAIPRYRKDNPAAGIKPDGQPHKSNKEAFTGAQLRCVLALAENRKFGGKRHTEVMWLIKLAIYTGARINELAQLRKTDVFSKPVPYIHIREGGNGQSVKTGKARKVPLHFAVADFVNCAKVSETDFIFDMFPDDDVNHRAGWLIANFGVFLRKVCKITDRNVTLHSTRHRFTDAGRNAGISEQRIKELKDGVKGYGSGTDIRELAKSVELMNPLAD
jgi:integrase